MLPSALPLGVQVLVLCAEWCSQCRSFLPLVQGLPGLHWVDIEDAGLDAEELGISAFFGQRACCAIWVRCGQTWTDFCRRLRN
jgi:hypothetical protein